MAIGALRSQVFSLVLIALAGSHAAQSTKVSAPLAREVFGDVDRFRVRPDGTLAVFGTDDERGFGELTSVALKGAPVRTTLASVTGLRRGFELTADGARVVYLDRDLFSVPVDGSAAPVRLHEPTTSIFQLEDFRMAAGGRVVFQGRFPDTAASRLHSVPADGSAAHVPLGGPAVATSGTFEVSPDGQTAVWVARQGSNLFLWSAPTDGSGPAVQLTGAPLAARSPLDFSIAPDSSRVAFLRAPLAVEDFALYSVPIDGSAAPVQLSDALVAGGDVQQGFAFTPDSQRVLYRADRDEDDVVELFSVRANGSGAPLEISGTLVEDGDVRSFQATPDSQRVVYVADQEVDERPWLYAARVDGAAAPVRIGGALSDSEALDFLVHPASTSVLFRADEGDGRPALLVADLAGGPAFELSDNVAADYALAPDGRWVVFARRSSDGLFAVPLNASRAPVRLNDDGTDVVFLPGGRTVLFLAQPSTAHVHELYRVSVAGTGLVKLSGELATGEVFGDVSRFVLDQDGKQLVYDAQGSTLDTPIVADEAVGLDMGPQHSSLQLFPRDTNETDIFRYAFSPDRKRLVYLAGNDPAETSELFSLRLDGVTPVVRLTESVGWSSVVSFETTADSRSIVYVRSEGSSNVRHLFAVDIDRTTDPVELNGPLVEDGEVRGFVVGPDSSRVVYAADEHEAGRVELFRRELTGGASVPLIANPPLYRWSAGGLQLTPDGKTVLFIADLAADDVFELFAMRSDGRSQPVKLSPTPLVATGDVSSFALSPDGLRVVILGDLETEGVRELFGAPTDGTAPAAKLSGTMVAGGGITFFPYPYRFTPDGSRVVFAIDRETDEVFELYSAPADGSAAPVKLSGAMVNGGDVGPFAISPDATRVVFLADRLSDEVFELFVAPADGSAAPTRLSGAMVAGGDVDSRVLELSPDGVWAAFVADRVTDGVQELFVAPLDASQEPLRRNGPLVDGGDVFTHPFERAVQFTPRSDRVLYIADQDTDEVRELYESPLPRLRTAPRGVAHGR